MSLCGLRCLDNLHRGLRLQDLGGGDSSCISQALLLPEPSLLSRSERIMHRNGNCQHCLAPWQLLLADIQLPRPLHQLFAQQMC